MPSKGEERIIKILRANNVHFFREKSFQDFRNGLFRYDFYIPNYNQKQICIEFDGQQHFEQIKFFQKQRKDFMRAQENDRRKNSYCLANNIELYRIPFWELDNIKTLSDIFNSKFKVKNKWHNDFLWREYEKTIA